MNNLLRKEIRLAASPLSFFFLAFSLMFFLPGYPVLCGAFFVTLGIFQSFQHAREANDVLFSVLLPIAKQDVVKGKYLFSCLIEICAFLLMALVSFIRLTFLSEAAVYQSNVMMNPNGFALGMALLIFGLFNLLFINGFFKPGFRFACPFICYAIAAFIVILISEALHHFPGMERIDSVHFDTLQLCVLGAGVVCYTGLTAWAYRLSCKRFERIDF